MPLYKVWNSMRAVKKFVVADSLDNLKKSGQVKLQLKLCTHIIDLTLVMEKDGTVVDGDEILNELQGETYMLLEPGDSWNSATSGSANESIAATVSTPLPEILSNPPLALSFAGQNGASPLSNTDSDCSQPYPTTPTSRQQLLPMSPRIEMSGSNTSKNFTVPLPRLSTFVHESLLAGRILDCLNNLVAEFANFYISSYELISSAQYKEVGIRFPQGAEPWSLFCEKLSQKLRNIRFQRRRKSDGNIGKFKTTKVWQSDHD